jgi:hypothetical protein
MPGEGAFSYKVWDGASGTVVDLDNVVSFSRADCLADLKPSLAAALTDCDDVLITTSLTTAGFEARQPLIREIAEVRHAATSDGRALTTFFIACENNAGPTYPEFVEELKRFGVESLPTMVNRLCYFHEEDAQAAGVRVRVDEVAEWVVQGDATTPLLQTLEAGCSAVLFVPDIGPYKTRKHWLVNGGHLALGIMARDRKQSLLNIAAAEPEVTNWLKRYHREAAQVVERQWPFLQASEVYGGKHVQAWRRHEDGVSHVLSRFNRANLLPFLEDLDYKLGAPARAAKEQTGVLPNVFSAIFDALQRILTRMERYEDFDLFKEAHAPGWVGAKPRLDADIDRSVLERYSRLLQDLLEPNETGHRVRRLDKSFQLDRNRFRGQATDV